MSSGLTPLETPLASPQHYGNIDGLRGLAILMVLLNHLMPNLDYGPSRVLQWTSNLAQSGWSGVDLFFVLSGFLITGILQDNRGTPHAVSAFYARRILRIFPLYYASLCLAFNILPVVLPAAPATVDAEGAVPPC